MGIFYFWPSKISSGYNLLPDTWLKIEEFFNVPKCDGRHKKNQYIRRLTWNLKQYTNY